MKLRNIGVDNLPLYERIHCDPQMMEHPGEPCTEGGGGEAPAVLTRATLRPLPQLASAWRSSHATMSSSTRSFSGSFMTS
jgi:hypothetical protein